MIIRDFIEKCTAKLKKIGISTAKLDVEVLLSDQLNKDRSWLHAHLDEQLKNKDLEAIKKQVSKRQDHVPLAYIRGKQEFYGRDFYVTPDTLTPRPETETLVDIALKYINKHEIKSVLDVGTGSGCIAITIDLETDLNLKIAAVDSSKPALEVAKKNTKYHSSKTIFIKDNIATSTNNYWSDYEMVVANLPYVPDEFNINLAASHEPKQAIYGGKDGLNLYRVLFSKLKSTVKYVLTESLPTQHPGLRKIAKKYGFDEIETSDFIQVFVRKRDL